jgi:hypothetical protein
VARYPPRASDDLSKSQLILEHLPDYRFQTAHEILTMLEQVNENSQDDTVEVVLSQMRKLGVLDPRTTEVKYGLCSHRAGLPFRFTHLQSALADCDSAVALRTHCF